MLGLISVASPAFASDAPFVTAVFSNTSNGYERTKMADGSFKRETYALARGQYLPGADSDRSIDGVQFPQIAGLIARHLALQNYYLAENSKSADLLILISWGTTVPLDKAPYQRSMEAAFTAMNDIHMTNMQAQAAYAVAGGVPYGPGAPAPNGPAAQVAAEAYGPVDSEMITLTMFNDMRRSSDEYNARLLGYSKEINEKDNLSRYSGGGSYYDDLWSDIEEPRYFVVIEAYDFKAAAHEQKRKLLWATRVSIRAQHNKFNERFPAMMANAADFFGHNTSHLMRDYHTGSVHLGEMKSLGVVPDQPDQPAK